MALTWEKAGLGPHVFQAAVCGKAMVPLGSEEEGLCLVKCVGKGRQESTGQGDKPMLSAVL